MELSPHIMMALAAKLPGLPTSAEVEPAFLSIAIYMDAPTDVMRLTDKGQYKVLRRLASGKIADPQKSDFVDLCLRSIYADQGRRLKAINMEKMKKSPASKKNKRRAERQRKQDVRDEDRRLVRSLSMPVTRLAAEPEHRAVLVGLPGQAFHRTPEWRRVRYEALMRAGSRCQSCREAHKQGVKLFARHIVSRLVAPERTFDLSNIRIVCATCDAGSRPPAG